MKKQHSTSPGARASMSLTPTASAPPLQTKLIQRLEIAERLCQILPECESTLEYLETLGELRREILQAKALAGG